MTKILRLIVLTVVSLSFSAVVSAQNFVFTSLDGDRVDVEAHKGKVVVMAIGASWLPLSDDQAGTVNKLARIYASSDDVVIYFIATDSASSRNKNFASDDDLKKFGRRNRLSVSILRDSEGQKSVKKYDIDQLPAFIILDKQGAPAGEPITGIDPLSKVDLSKVISRRINSLL